MSKIHNLIRLLLVLAPFFLPWWLMLIFVLAAVFLYDRYYEIILIGFMCDILYHSEVTYIGLYGFTLLACILFILVKQIKQKLILY